MMNLRMRDAPQNECSIMKADDGCVGCVETAKQREIHTQTKREDEEKKGVVGHSDFMTNFVVLFLNNEIFFPQCKFEYFSLNYLEKTTKFLMSQNWK